MSNEMPADECRLERPLSVPAKRDDFDQYAFLADFDITRSSCGPSAGRYASELTQRAYMVWADQQREIERLRSALTIIYHQANGAHPSEWGLCITAIESRAKATIEA